MQLEDMFKSVDEVNHFFSNWHQKTDNERLEFVRTLRNNGLLTTVKEPLRAEFVCPINHFSVSRPCNLNSCPYNIAHSSSKNCLIHMLNNSKCNRLQTQEVADLFKVPLNDVNDVMTMATNKIKKTVIKEHLEALFVTKFKYLDGHCINCDVSIHDDLEMDTLDDKLIIEPGKFGWCSTKCMNIKPKWQFEIEKEFQYNYITVLSIGYSIYKHDINILVEIPKEVWPYVESEIKLYSSKYL